jgi:ribosomal protein S18 acetylase RimI-like enzyme
MINLQTGLQKKIFLESMSLIQEPGWEVFEEGDLIAFKASVSVPFMNFVYGNVTLAQYEKVKAFYEKKPFFWLLSETQEERLLLDWGFTGPDFTYEMGLNLADYQYYSGQEPIEVREVSSYSEDYLQWVNVAAGWLNIDPAFVDQFFTPWIKTGKYIPYLGFYEGKPAATSLAYLGNLGASLYCLGTLPDFRNRGLGTAVTHACLKAAKHKNIGQAVLYGSKMGQPMYKKIGFKLMQIIREYSCTEV